MLVYLICFAVSWIFAFFQLYYLSGLVLLLAAGFLYYYDYHKSGNLIHLRGLFSAFWVGGQGIACLKLSKLQSDWSLLTWSCFFLAFMGFWITFEIMERLFGEGYRPIRKGRRGKSAVRPLFVGVVVITYPWPRFCLRRQFWDLSLCLSGESPTHTQNFILQEFIT